MNIIKVNYQSTNNAYKAKQFIEEIKKYPIIAWDFETAIKYTQEQIDEWKTLLSNPELSKMERVNLQSKVDATSLDHPSHCMITHCSIAISEDEAYVFILDNTTITKFILNFLVNSPQKQVLHNASYDFRFLQYFTNGLPKDYEDTMILAKTLLNHVETYKASVKLKELAGHMYGQWAISADSFTLERMYDSDMLLYSGTDSCATMWLWNYINAECDAIDSKVEG
jgi:DNA polymerase I-like protein with 3'-5' exonuclease and polymerase domains